MRFDIITAFPNIFDSYFNESLFGRAIKKGIIKINPVNLRDFAKDKYRKIDDSPFGGGPGMVLKAEPILQAVVSLLKPNSKFQILNSKRVLNPKRGKKAKTRIILFSTRGKKFDQKTTKRFSKYDELILICGRYEGVDERVAKYVADEEISIGDYVLSGGELAAMVVIEAVSRYIPGFLGKYESLEDIKGSYPVYTRPVEFILKKGKKKIITKVPEALLHGNHKEIATWRALH